MHSALSYLLHHNTRESLKLDINCTTIYNTCTFYTRYVSQFIRCSTESSRFFGYKKKYLSNEIRKPIAIAIEIFNYNICRQLDKRRILEMYTSYAFTISEIDRTLSRSIPSKLDLRKKIRQTTIITILYVNATTCRKIV